MRRTDKKLKLSLATVKSLSDDDLRGIAGGARASDYCPYSEFCTVGTSNCPTNYPPCDPNHTYFCPPPQTSGCPISG